MSTTTTVAEMAAELVRLQDQAETLNATITGIKAQLAEQHPDPGNYDAGPFTIRISVAHRKDTKHIEADFPPAKHPDLYKPALDTKRVDAFFELSREYDLTDYQTAGTPSVKVL